MLIYLLFLAFASALAREQAKLVEKYSSMSPYMTIKYTLDGKLYKEDTIWFELFWKETPETALNFAMILEGTASKDGKPLSYKDNIFHRIIKDFMMQGGDITNSNGSGGMSIYGKNFKDEDFSHPHAKGVLSMANAGPNTNSSQFFITFTTTPYLNGRHVVFGKVVDEGMDVVDKIANVKTQAGTDMPKHPVRIIDCGFKHRKSEKYL